MMKSDAQKVSKNTLISYSIFIFTEFPRPTVEGRSNNQEKILKIFLTLKKTRIHFVVQKKESQQQHSNV